MPSCAILKKMNDRPVQLYGYSRFYYDTLKIATVNE